MTASDKAFIQVYKDSPKDFEAVVEVSACYVECGDEILLMKRSRGKSEEGYWGIPAGKVEKGENIFESVARELKEETNIELLNSDFIYIGTLYIRKPEIDYMYHMFHTSFDSKPDVKLSSEHEEYRWIKLDEVQTVPLMQGAEEALTNYKKYLNLTQKQTANVNSYLILKKEEQTLLALRKNTGYMDGYWCLVAGHAEKGETPSDAIIREANEEIGIEIAPEDLTHTHTMHRMTDRHNVDVFFTCTKWNGTPTNTEPHKCEEISFFPTREIPKKSCGYIIHALKQIENNQPYSEYAEN